MREAADKLGCSVRTVQRLVKRWQVEGVSALVTFGRANQGKHRISEFWQDFIVKTYEAGNKGSKRMKPKQVAVRVQVKAREVVGDGNPPSYKTVLRVLKPIIERKERPRAFAAQGGGGQHCRSRLARGKISRSSTATMGGSAIIPVLM